MINLDDVGDGSRELERAARLDLAAARGGGARSQGAGPRTLRDPNSRATKAEYPHNQSTFSPNGARSWRGVPDEEQAKIGGSTPPECTISTWEG